MIVSFGKLTNLGADVEGGKTTTNHFVLSLRYILLNNFERQADRMDLFKLGGYLEYPGIMVCQ